MFNVIFLPVWHVNDDGGIHPGEDRREDGLQKLKRRDLAGLTIVPCTILVSMVYMVCIRNLTQIFGSVSLLNFLFFCMSRLCFNKDDPSLKSIIFSPIEKGTQRNAMPHSLNRLSIKPMQGHQQ